MYYKWKTLIVSPIMFLYLLFGALQEADSSDSSLQYKVPAVLRLCCRVRIMSAYIKTEVNMSFFLFLLVGGVVAMVLHCVP